MMWVGEIAHSLGVKIIQMGKGEMNLFNKYWEESGTHMQTNDAGPKSYYTQTVSLTLILQYCGVSKSQKNTVKNERKSTLQNVKKIFRKYLVRD